MSAWRPAEAKRCVHCGIYRGLHQFPALVEGEPDDEYRHWCLPCLRGETEHLRTTATTERSS